MIIVHMIIVIAERTYDMTPGPSILENFSGPEILGTAYVLVDRCYKCSGGFRVHAPMAIFMKLANCPTKPMGNATECELMGQGFIAMLACLLLHRVVRRCAACLRRYTKTWQTNLWRRKQVSNVVQAVLAMVHKAGQVHHSLMSCAVHDKCLVYLRSSWDFIVSGTTVLVKTKWKGWHRPQARPSCTRWSETESLTNDNGFDKQHFLTWAA